MHKLGAVVRKPSFDFLEDRSLLSGYHAMPDWPSFDRAPGAESWFPVFSPAVSDPMNSNWVAPHQMADPAGEGFGSSQNGWPASDWPAGSSQSWQPGSDSSFHGGGRPSGQNGGYPFAPSGGDAPPPTGGNPSAPNAGNPSVPNAGNPSAPNAGNPSAPNAGNPSAPSDGNSSTPGGSASSASNGGSSQASQPGGQAASDPISPVSPTVAPNSGSGSNSGDFDSRGAAPDGPSANEAPGGGMLPQSPGISVASPIAIAASAQELASESAGVASPAQNGTAPLPEQASLALVNPGTSKGRFALQADSAGSNIGFSSPAASGAAQLFGVVEMAAPGLDERAQTIAAKRW